MLRASKFRIKLPTDHWKDETLIKSSPVMSCAYNIFSLYDGNILFIMELEIYFQEENNKTDSSLELNSLS